MGWHTKTTSIVIPPIGRRVVIRRHNSSSPHGCIFGRLEILRDGEILRKSEGREIPEKRGRHETKRNENRWQILMEYMQMLELELGTS